MKPARIILYIFGAGFVAFGLMGLLLPESLVALIDIELNSVQARTEITAMYGGMQIGIGAFLLMAALNETWIRPAMAAVICMCLGLASARLLGIQLEGGAFPWMLPVAMLELAMVAGCIWGWRAAGRDLA